MIFSSLCFLLSLKYSENTWGFIFIYFMCVGILPECISVWGCRVPWNWSYSFELPGPLEEPVSVLNHWATTPVPHGDCLNNNNKAIFLKLKQNQAVANFKIIIIFNFGDPRLSNLGKADPKYLWVETVIKIGAKDGGSNWRYHSVRGKFQSIHTCSEFFRRENKRGWLLDAATPLTSKSIQMNVFLMQYAVLLRR